MNIFKMRRAGPLSTWAPGPARRILKMFISKKTKEGGDPPPSTYMFVLGNTCKPDLAYTSSLFPREIVNPCCLCCRFLLIQLFAMAGPGKRTTSINKFPGKQLTGVPQSKPTWVNYFPGKQKTGVRKKSRMAHKKKSRLVLALDYPPTTSPTH